MSERSTLLHLRASLGIRVLRLRTLFLLGVSLETLFVLGCHQSAAPYTDPMELLGLKQQFVTAALQRDCLELIRLSADSVPVFQADSLEGDYRALLSRSLRYRLPKGTIRMPGDTTSILHLYQPLSPKGEVLAIQFKTRDSVWKVVSADILGLPYKEDSLLFSSESLSASGHTREGENVRPWPTRCWQQHRAVPTR
jgi:hypothetical protein